MPACYEIHDSVDLKYVRIEGKTHLHELRDLASRYRDDPRYSTRRQLVDLTALVDARAGFKDVMSLRNFYMRHFGPLVEPIPVAIAAPTDLGYGIARMFYMLMVGNGLMDIRIFDDLAAACTWLRIDMHQDQRSVRFAPLLPTQGGGT